MKVCWEIVGGAIGIGSVTNLSYKTAAMPRRAERVDISEQTTLARRFEDGDVAWPRKEFRVTYIRFSLAIERAFLYHRWRVGAGIMKCPYFA